jgi:hypothetical protein
VTRTGIDDPGHDDDDRQNEPEPLDVWITEGFDPDDAEGWRNWRYNVTRAQAWRLAGVEHGLEAAQWATAGVTEATVTQWRAAGIDPAEAVQWHERGLNLSAAKEMKAKGITASDAFPKHQGQSSMSIGPAQRFVDAGVPGDVFHSYFTRQWLDDDAFSWAKAGVEAGEAQIWKQLGVRPLEAERLTKAGVTVADAVRDWWRAGIPYDEVADWLGAGLAPREAAAQRAKGVTAEQAAALRALRDQPDL